MEVDYYSTNKELIEYFKYLSKETLENGLLFLENDIEFIDDILLKDTFNNIVSGLSKESVISNFGYKKKVVYEELIKRHEILRIIFKSVLEPYISYSDYLLTCFFYDEKIETDKRIKFQEENIPFLIFLIKEKSLKKRNNLELANFLNSFTQYIRRSKESMDTRFYEIKKYLYDKVDDVLIKYLLDTVFQKRCTKEMIDIVIDEKLAIFIKNWENRCDIILELSLMIQKGIKINEIEKIDELYLEKKELGIVSKFEKTLQLVAKYYIGLKAKTGENYINYLMNIISKIEDENSKIAFLISRGINEEIIPINEIADINLSIEIMEIVDGLKKEEDNWDINFKNMQNEKGLKILKVEQEYLGKELGEQIYINGVNQIDIYLKQIEEKKLDDKTAWSYKKSLYPIKNSKKVVKLGMLKKWKKDSEAEHDFNVENFFKEFKMPLSLKGNEDIKIEEIIKDRYVAKENRCEIGVVIDYAQELANIIENESIRDFFYYYIENYNLEALSEVNYITDIKKDELIIYFSFFQFEGELRAELFGYNGDYYGAVRNVSDYETKKRIVLGEIFDS